MEDAPVLTAAPDLRAMPLAQIPAGAPVALDAAVQRVLPDRRPVRTVGAFSSSI